MRRMVVVLAAGALAVAACGDDDDEGGTGDVSAEEQPYVDAIAVQFTSDDPDELQLTDEQAECVAPRWVDTIGLDTLQEADVSAEDITDDTEDELATLGLDESQGNELYDAFEACDVDVAALLATSIGADEDLDDETVECVADNLGDEDLARRLMVAVVTQGEEAIGSDTDLTDDFTTALTECVPEGG